MPTFSLPIWGRHLWMLLLFLSITAGTPAFAAGEAPAPEDARQLIDNALESMGGAEKLRGLKAVRIEAIGHTNLIEQSERPEGPYAISYDQLTEWRDFENTRLRQTAESRSPAIGAPSWSPASATIIADGVCVREVNGRKAPFSYAQVLEAEELLALGPERVLLNALAASDLHADREAMLQGQPHTIVAFTWRGTPVRIYLNAYTHLPTAVEVVRANPYDIFWSVWGDVTTRTYYSIWTLEAGGVRLPHQLDVERNGLPYKTLTIAAMELNPKLDAEAFAIPDEVKKAFESRGKRLISDMPLGRPDQPAKEIGKDVVQIPGSWNVEMIRQPDGVVILEAPISSGYSAKVIAEAEKRYPHVPIKAVISTSDSWPHFGGLREYVARGIPAYILDLNRPIVERLVAAPYRSYPDALEKARRKADFRVVSKKTVIGSGPSRIELYPIRSESGERMLMVYWPEQHLLYCSDLIQQWPSGSFFMPEYLAEVRDVAGREHLSVDAVFAMHSRPLEWSKITAAIAQAEGR